MVEDICGWTALAGHRADFAPLRGTQTADVAIIGGGFTGLAAARQLAALRPSARIALIDGKRIGEGASARNSGFAVANESPGHAQLHTDSGLASYRTMNRLDHAGVAELRQLTGQLGIDCQWEDTGSIHAAHDPANFDRLRHHAETFQRLRIDARLIEGKDLHSRLGTSFYSLGVESRGGALLQPAKLAQGLATTLPDQVTCYDNSPVRRIDRDGAGWLLELAGGTITAPQVIVAVNAFFPRLALKSLRLFPLALTASLTRPLTAEEEAQIGHAPSWGVLSPQSLGATMRLTQDRRILIRNTAEYRPSGIDSRRLDSRVQVHADGLAKRFPFLQRDAIAYSWSGSICISRNAKPVFEQSQPGLFLCGGYNASGVSRGSIMGKLIADYACGQDNPLLSDALSLIKPNLIPPRPFFDFGVKLRMAAERRAARPER
ncbi:FAD-binding oxidoreductase [Phaeobacter sp.]|uniref:NAD(P)/FAD-dependent oxidoreductase n=1 Tax=Phaeobacter sp. TaxID=1902409 RepID=UPI0025EF1C22|nr:FAD-binding oxidoreductase [Phaeobacter sp.]